MTTNILTPTGRLVAGSLYEPQTKDTSGRPLVIKSGPDAGKPTQKFYFGLAIAKTQPQWWNEPWAAGIVAEAQATMANFIQLPHFAWKITDGDSATPNQNGRKPCDNEGYPGHWVLNFSSSFAPKIYNSDGSAPLPERDAVKLGHFVQVAGTVEGNGDSGKPGVYLNHRMVAFQGFGPEIFRGPDPSTVGFGKGPAPAGMSVAPVGNLSPAAGLPAAPAPGPAFPGSAPGSVAPAAPAAPVAVTPHPGFVHGPDGAPAAPVAPMAPPPPPPPPPPAGPVMTAKAAGVPYASFIAQGWNDATLRANGYLV